MLRVCPHSREIMLELGLQHLPFLVLSVVQPEQIWSLRPSVLIGGIDLLFTDFRCMDVRDLRGAVRWFGRLNEASGPDQHPCSACGRVAGEYTAEEKSNGLHCGWKLLLIYPVILWNVNRHNSVVPRRNAMILLKWKRLSLKCEEIKGCVLIDIVPSKKCILYHAWVLCICISR